jgi:uncharacterized protein (TIGR03435 family)
MSRMVSPALSQTPALRRYRMRMKLLVRVAALIVATGLAAAQRAPVFEVASVRVSQLAKSGGEGATREGLELSPGSLRMHNISLRSAIRWAYGVMDFQISGPGWLAAERYDIVAKAPDSKGADRMRPMLQALLAERFRMAVHRETKDLPLYALLVGKKGPKMEPAKAGGPAAMRPNGGALEFRNTSMPELAERLTTRPFRMDRPVIDQTGLPGAFDFTLKLAGGGAELKSTLEQAELQQDTSLFRGALQDLGLRLEARKGPVEIVVVDRSEKVPLEN